MNDPVGFSRNASQPEAEDVFAALADARRRAVLDALNRTDSLSADDLSHLCHIPRRSVVKHLAILELAGLVNVGWHSDTMTFSLERAPLLRLWQRWQPKQR